MRPIKERHIEQMPPVSQFKPVGVPLFKVDEIVITVEEMEAIRLADVEELDQGPASVLMGISRPTFHRILAKAHTKIAQALWQGKSLRVDGGTYRMKCCDLDSRQYLTMPERQCLALRKSAFVLLQPHRSEDHSLDSQSIL